MVVLDLTQLPSTQVGSDAAFADLAKGGGNWLKYLKLCSNDKYAKAGKIPSGHWGLPGQDDAIEDLGDSIDVLPLARRPKALDTSDRSAIVTCYDEQSEQFKDIAAKSAEKDSGCQYGISFLVLERSTGQFYEVFFGSKTVRPEAKNVYPYLPLTQPDIDRLAAAGQDMTDVTPHGPRPLTLKTKLVKNKKGQMWHVPVAIKCSTPFTKLPPVAEIAAEIVKFTSAKSGGTEKVKEPEGRKARAR
jgi:hypothetical protein